MCHGAWDGLLELCSCQVGKNKFNLFFHSISSEPACNVGNPCIHQLLLRDISQYDLDHIFCLCDALGPDAEEDAKMVLEWQDGFQYLPLPYSLDFEFIGTNMRSAKTYQYSCHIEDNKI